MIAEITLAIAGITLLVSNVRAYNIKSKDQKLLAEHTAMAEIIMEDGSPFERSDTDPWYQHRWAQPSKDVLYTSQLPWSYEQVIVNIAVCEKCQTVHRYIVRGMELAKKRGLQMEEGFYYSGVKISNPGCPFPDNPGVFAQLPEWQEAETLDAETPCISQEYVVE